MIFLLLTFIITGKAVSQDLVNSAKTIKIGLLIQDSSHISAVQGAELAVRIANKDSGMNGRPFKLVVRSMEGPWGTGSKQAVNLIFEDKVWALLGSHDGRNAHLVEQVATKATVVFISAWAGDPTLSQAFVPWFFNCVHNDLQQAEAIVGEIFNKRAITTVAVISDNDYDSKQSLYNYLRMIKMKGKPNPLQFTYENYSRNISGLLDQMNRNGVKSVVLLCKPSVSYQIFKQMQQNKMSQPLFGPLYLLNGNELSDSELMDFGNALLVPSGRWPDEKSSAFRREFEEIYGKQPGMVAAYAFDGMNLLIEAIRAAGDSDRNKIQKALAGIKYNGVTGTIMFDERGNRSDKAVLTELRNGIPVSAAK